MRIYRTRPVAFAASDESNTKGRLKTGSHHLTPCPSAFVLLMAFFAIFLADIFFAAQAQAQGNDEELQGTGASTEGRILMPEASLRQLEDVLERIHDLSLTLYLSTKSEKLYALGEITDNLADYANLGRAISVDLSHRKLDRYAILSAETTSAIGRLGSKMPLDPTYLNDLFISGVISETTAKSLGSLSFGGPDIAEGVGTLVGSGHITNVDGVTKTLDGINQTAWGIFGYLISDGNPKVANAVAAFGHLVAATGRDITASAFYKIYARSTGLDQTLINGWREAQLRARATGEALKSVEEYYGRDRNILDAIGDDKIRRANREFGIFSPPNTHGPNALQPKVVDQIERHTYEHYREVCVGGFCARQELAIIAAPIGGVRLDRTAEWATNPYPQVRSVVLNDSTGSLILVGDQGWLSTGLKIRDLAMALWLAYGPRPESPQFSLDPADPANPRGAWLKAVYLPALMQGHSFGRELFEADYLLKQYGLGVRIDSQRKIHQRESAIRGFKSYAAMAMDEPKFGNGNEEWSRFWIVVNKIFMKQSDQAITFDIHMGVQARREVPDSKSPTGLRDIPTASTALPSRWARSATAQFDALANEEHALARVRELAKAVGIAKWLRQQCIPIDMKRVVQLLNADKTPTVSKVSALTASWVQETREPFATATQRGIRIRRIELRMFGGVDLTEEPSSVPGDEVTRMMQTKVMNVINRNLNRGFHIFNIRNGNHTLEAAVIPLLLRRQLTSAGENPDERPDGHPEEHSHGHPHHQDHCDLSP